MILKVSAIYSPSSSDIVSLIFGKQEGGVDNSSDANIPAGERGRYPPDQNRWKPPGRNRVRTVRTGAKTARSMALTGYRGRCGAGPWPAAASQAASTSDHRSSCNEIP